jgi:hypothetical protein
MKHPLHSLGTASLLVLLTAAAPARADLLRWRYDWSATPRVVTADGRGTGGVFMTDEPPGQATGSQRIAVTWMGAYSSATPARPDRFTNRPYLLTLVIHDDASGAVGVLNFSGVLNGTLTASSAALRNTFTGRTSRTLHLGHHLYRVTLGAPATPGLVGMAPQYADIRVSHNPEPPGFVLAALAVLLPGFGRAWRRSRAARDSAGREPG